MNAALIHLASIQCWQRAESLGLTPGVFIVLQILSASSAKNGMSKRTLEKESRLVAATVDRHLDLLLGLELVFKQKLPRNNLPGHQVMGHFLSDKGRELMMPKPHVERSAV